MKTKQTVDEENVKALEDALKSMWEAYDKH